MSSSRIINLNPQFTDVIKLDPTERVIWLGKGQGLYLNIDYITCPDVNLNGHKRVINGSYISQYEVETIRVRNHYPRVPGKAWNKIDVYYPQYRLTDQNKNIASMFNNVNRIQNFVFDFGIRPLDTDNLIAGNLWLLNQNARKCINQCAFKETLFLGYKDGISIAYPDYGVSESLYHAMYYSYQSPYAPVLGETEEYYSDLVTDATVTEWQEVDALNKSNNTWTINYDLQPFYALTQQQDGFTGRLYGMPYNSHATDPRCQLLEFQIVTKTGKIGTRLYYLFFIPQCIPKLATYMDIQVTNGTNTFTHGDINGWAIEPGEIILNVGTYTPGYSRCCFVTKGITYSNLLPLPFPLNTNWIEKEITVTTTIPTSKTITLFHPCIQGSVKINGEDFIEINYNSEEELGDNEFSISNYQIPRLTKEGYLTECGTILIFSTDNINDGITIVYNTPVIDPEQIQTVMSAIPFKENDSNLDYSRPLLDSVSPDSNYYGGFHKWDWQDIIAYNQYYLYNEKWYNYSWHEFWIILNLTESTYLPCGEDFSHHSMFETNGVKNFEFGHFRIAYDIPTGDWSVYGQYPPAVAYPETLFDTFTTGRISYSDPNQEALYTYKTTDGGQVNATIHTRSDPVSQPPPEDPDVWYHFLSGQLHGRIKTGIYGFCNDGNTTRGFINGTQRYTWFGNKTSFTSDFESNDMIFLPLINTQNPPTTNGSTAMLSFLLQNDYDHEDALYHVYPNPVQDSPQTRLVVLNSIAFSNHSDFNVLLDFLSMLPQVYVSRVGGTPPP